MAKLIVFESVTLDGVMQGPARPDEDTRGGFQQGGWGAAYPDPVATRVTTRDMADPSGVLLLGRRTYENFYHVWPNRSDNPYTDVLNKTMKFVASRTLKEPLPWMNSSLLKGDLPDAVREMKNRAPGRILVLGSGELVRNLMPHNLIDEYVLLITPLVLGSGRRLFPDQGQKVSLRLVRSEPTTTGVVIATYQPA